MKVRFFSIIMITLACLTFTSCEDEPTPEPTIIPPEIPNKLVGTRWVAHNENRENLPDLSLSGIMALEFVDNGYCIIDELYSDSIQPRLYYYTYDETKNSITTNDYNFIIDENELIITHNYMNETYTYRFITDNNYIAPAKDNNLVGLWKAIFKYSENSSYSITSWIKIIDNKRLISIFDDINSVQNEIEEYNYDGKYLYFGNWKLKIKGYQMITDNISYNMIQRLDI